MFPTSAPTNQPTTSNTNHTHTMKTALPESVAQAIPDGTTVNHEQALYVIPSGGGFSCLGFQVAIDCATRLAAELAIPFTPAPLGSLANYDALRSLRAQASLRYSITKKRVTCELSPQLIGLEGRRVEVVTNYDETRRFKVGRSTGWIPIHLELANVRSSGGGAAERTYKSVRVIR